MTARSEHRRAVMFLRAKLVMFRQDELTPPSRVDWLVGEVNAVTLFIAPEAEIARDALRIAERKLEEAHEAMQVAEQAIGKLLDRI